MQIVAATKNIGKVKELKQLLADLSVCLRSLNEFPDVVEAEETGATFTENAVLKAQSYALQTGLWSLADDSGLEVEALGSAPGIFSARYGGASATNEEKIQKLLRQLNAKLSNEERRARFVCAMAISDAKGEIKYLAEEMCGGRIALTPKGTNGFGYDPIFIPDGFEKTFGELSDEIKQKISHRARAAEKIIQYLRAFTAVSLDQ
ncbi:MAG: RdgB/HAM1 family non-canonical purine NTP pyrophosphatase [Acidobacteriota bacterium]|nr:RdgB/HAM1 family non-canonical purine NTP pyrophosphatase [Acidobacteriota bacterium]